jgi:mono/diheme cytochrome c family protein
VVARLLGVLAIIVLAVITVTALARPSIDPITPPGQHTFDPALVKRGAQLAAIGNCAGCHTASEKSPYAGGLAMATPFGKIYSTNITPDPKTGIGTWSEEAFRRAMQEGISRDGHHLYPAFPYDHFTRLSRDDIKALYAFFMTRDPINAPAHANDLRFPFGFRPLIAVWNSLYLDKRSFALNPSQSQEWNRGAYLADTLGHCSACHSPRNKLGEEDKRQYLGGGEAENWYAPALNAKSPSPVPWSVEALHAYLRTGLAPDHAIAGGPMQDVVDGLKYADEKDVHAIATYIHSMLGTPTAEQQTRADSSRRRAALSSITLAKPTAPIASSDEERQLQLGATVYTSACASCHDAGRQLSSDGALPLPLAIAVYDPDPRNLIHIVRNGIFPAADQRGRWMPAFSGTLTDEQLTALVVFLRHYAADAPPWPKVADTVQKAKSP